MSAQPAPQATQQALAQPEGPLPEGPRGDLEKTPAPPDGVDADLPLFREEALSYAERRLQGDVVLATPIRLTLFAYLLCALLVIGAIFVAIGSYSRKETVVGWIQPDAGIIRASALDGGIIEDVRIIEGASVSAGEELARLRVTTDQDAGRTGELILQSISAERAAAQGRYTSEKEGIEIDRLSLQQQNAAMKSLLEEARTRTDLSAERLAISEEDLKRAEKLMAAGAISEDGFETARSQVLQNQSTLSQARTAAITLERQIAENESKLAGVPADLAKLEAQLAETLAQLAQRETNASAQSTYIVTAPISGEVLAIPVEKGQILNGGGTIAVLAPAGSQLVADLFIPSRAAGFIKEGQEVRLMYQAFPHQKFGAGEGAVIRVSHTVLDPKEVPAPIKLEEPVFRVRVALERQTIDAYGEEISLQPGMLLTADVVIEKRSLLEWMLDPLYAVGRRL